MARQRDRKENDIQDLLYQNLKIKRRYKKYTIALKKLRYKICTVAYKQWYKIYTIALWYKIYTIGSGAKIDPYNKTRTNIKTRI